MIPQLDYAKPDLPRGGRGIAWTLAVLSIVAPLSSGWADAIASKFPSDNGFREFAAYYSIVSALGLAGVSAGLVARRYAISRQMRAARWVALIGICISGVFCAVIALGFYSSFLR